MSNVELPVGIQGELSDMMQEPERLAAHDPVELRENLIAQYAGIDRERDRQYRIVIDERLAEINAAREVDR